MDSVNGSARSSLSADSPSLNDDLLKLETRPKTGRTSSIVSSSFRASFDESTISLGLNTISTSSVSPLGKNSIYELIHGAEKSRRYAKNTLTVNGSTTVQLKGPTIKDIPPIQLSKITKIAASEFDGYLSDVEKYYEKYQNSRNLTESTLQAFIEKCENEEDSVADDIEKLSSIPEIYFQPEFRLDDPKVFKMVTENSDILTNDKERGKLSTNSELQERLSSYLDTVEIHLIHEISQSSDSFFDVIDDLRDIKVSSKKSIDLLSQLDGKFKELEVEQAEKGLNIAKDLQKRINVEKLEQSMLQVSIVLQYADIVENTFYNGKYTKCLDELDTLEKVISGAIDQEPANKLLSGFKYPLNNLTHLPALNNLRELLVNIRIDCGNAYSNLFLDHLLTDLRTHYEKVPAKDTINRMSSQLSRDRQKTISSLNTAYQVVDEEFKEKSKEYIIGLARSNNLASFFTILNEKLVAEFKQIIRTYLPNSTNYSQGDMDDATSNSSSTAVSSASRTSNSTLSPMLRNMTPKEFETMLIKIYTAISEALRRLKTQQKLLLDLALNSIQEKINENPDLIMNLDITQTINQCVETVQVRLSKIIGVRRDQNAEIPVNYLLRFYSLNVLLLSECELISGYNVTNSLNEVVNNQVRFFLNQFHSSNMRSLSGHVDREKWKEVDIDKKVQETALEIVASAELDPPNWLKVLDLYEESLPPENGETKTNSDEESEKTKPKETKALIVSGVKFIVPHLASDVINFIKDYVLLKIVFPHLAPNIEGNLADLLKMLNSKTTQAILGAGAIRTAHLKGITTKNLTLSSQILDLVLTLIPFLIQSFNRTRKSEESPLDKVKGILQEHQNEIFTKLVSIMNDRVLNHRSTIKTINWSEPAPRERLCNPYMETLVKETTTIAKVLQKYLSELQYSLILSQIFDSYKRQLLDEYTQIQFKDLIEKSLLMKDIDYFREKLSEIPGYGNCGQVIWENVNAIPTQEDVEMDARMRNNIAKEVNSNNTSARESMEVRKSAEIRRIE